MKNLFKLKTFLLYSILLVCFAFLFSCSQENVSPSFKKEITESRLTKRDGGGCTQCEAHVKSLVAAQFQIGIASILTCSYYGPTEGGCEYRLTYTSGTIGPSSFNIIGDDIEGC